MREGDALAIAGGTLRLQTSNIMTQAILDFLRNAVVEYGYWAVGLTLLAENVGIPVPGETILLLASFLAYS